MTLKAPFTRLWRKPRLILALAMALLLGTFTIPSIANESGAATADGKKNLSEDVSHGDGYRPSLATIEFTRWSDENTCTLLVHGSPLVKVYASISLSWSEYRTNQPQFGLPEFYCSYGLSASDASAIRRQALKDDPFNPVLLYSVYQADCAGAEPVTWCASERLPERLQALDPDNALVHLLHFDSGKQAHSVNDGFPVSPPDLTHLSLRDRKRLARAAAAKRFDTYGMAGTLEAHDVIRETLAARPAFVPSEEAMKSGDPEELDFFLELSAAGIVTLETLAASSASLPAYQHIMTACEAAHKNAETRTIGYCQSIGQLMAAAQSEVDTRIGESLLQLADTGAVAEPDENEAWRQSISVLIRVCELPKGLAVNHGLSGPMPEEHTALWLEDRVVMREYGALREAAIREYAIYPDDFTLDPARCADIAKLPDEVQQVLAEAFRANNQVGKDAWREAIEAAAVALGAE